MQVKDIMTQKPEYIPRECSLKEAAEKMRKLDCGFLPIGDDKEDRLQGVITDRDIVIRGMAKGKDPDNTTVDQVKSEKVLYCFADDSLKKATESMQQQQVYRLIVLDQPDTKRLCGIISLGDIMRHDQEGSAAEAAKAIMKAA